MINFNFCNPTKIIFGRGETGNVGGEVKKYSGNILLVYGGPNKNQTNIYSKVIKSLNENGIKYFEVCDIQPNPRIDKVREGIKLCRENGIDFILGVGGGSTIDTTKTIAAGVPYDGDPWDFFTGKTQIEKTLPKGVVVTLAATGSEMNHAAVIDNWDTREKMITFSPYFYPDFAILDPENTFTVPLKMTVYGSIDIMIHVFEQYFHHDKNSPIQDGFCETIIKTVMENIKVVVENPHNYEARANLMWCATLALNGLIGAGVPWDFATHRLGQVICAEFDITHGLSLAVVWPEWARYVIDEDCERFKKFAVELWNVSCHGKTDKEIGLLGIQKTEEFFEGLGVDISLKNCEPKEGTIDKMAQMAVDIGPVGGFKKLNKEDVKTILQRCFKKA